jgi:hypothetical protein
VPNTSQDRPQLHWFRWWIHTVEDPKFTTVARRAKQKRVVVLGVWTVLLESAAAENSGGAYAVPPDEIAAVLEIKTEQAAAVICALEERGMVKDGEIVNWERRQFASDSSTTRVRKHRSALQKQNETLQERSSNGDVTPMKQAVTDVTPSEDRGQRTEDSRVEEEEICAPPNGDAGLPPKPTDPPAEKKPEKTPEKTPTPIQAVIEEAWAAFGFEGKPGGDGFSELVKLVQEYGVEKVRRWCVWLRSHAITVGQGADPWKFFKRSFREAMHRDFNWDPEAQKPGGTRHTLPAALPSQHKSGRVDL